MNIQVNKKIKKKINYLKRSDLDNSCEAFRICFHAVYRSIGLYQICKWNKLVHARIQKGGGDRGSGPPPEKSQKYQVS